MNNEQALTPSLWQVLLDSLAPTALYELAWQWAGIASIFAVLFFSITPAIRVLTEMVNSLRTNQKMNTVGISVDLIICTLLYATYTTVGYALYKVMMFFMNVMGSFTHYERTKAITGQMAVHMDVGNFSMSIFDGFTLLPTFAIFLGYLFTQFLYMSMGLFIHYAHAFTFAAVVIVGPILISMSMWKPINYLAGWGKLLATLLMWPLVEWFGVGMVLTAVENAISNIPVDQFSDASSLVKMSFLWSLMIIVHLLILGIIISVPFVANVIVTGTGNIGATVLPFASAGAVAAKLAADGGKAGLNFAGKGVGNFTGNVGDKMMSAAAGSNALRNLMPGFDKALDANGMHRPSAAPSSFDMSRARPGSIADKFNNLERSTSVRSAQADRAPSVQDNGSGVGPFGEMATKSRPSVSGEGLSLIPKDSPTPTVESSKPELELTLEPIDPSIGKPQPSSNPNAATASHSENPSILASSTKPGLSAASKIVQEQAGMEESRLSMETGAPQTESEPIPSRSGSSKKQQKGYFIDQAMKASGKRKPK